MTDTPDTTGTDTLTLAVELTAAWLANPNTRAEPDAVPTFLTTVHGSIAALAGGAPKAEDQTPEATEYTPALTARKSLASPDHIISMIDGKPYRTLRRHLSAIGLTPDEYRQRYNLKADYPMVAPNYSESRRAMAQKIGLGRKKGETVAKPATTKAPGRGRGKKDA